MELPDHSMTVPEGITIAPAHFLTAPDDDFREDIEGNNHEHYIIKVVATNENLEMRLFGSFTRVEDRFSFDTSELQNGKLCFLTTGILSKLLPGISPNPVCNHGITKIFVVSRKKRVCPHINRALALNLLCEDIVRNDGDKVAKYLERYKEVCFNDEDDGKYPWDQLSPNLKYELKIKFGEATKEIPFSFLKLCRSNGMLRLGDIDSQLQNVNCIITISLDIYERPSKESEWTFVHPFSVHLDPCKPGECDMIQAEARETHNEAGRTERERTSTRTPHQGAGPSMAQYFHGERHTASGGNFILGDTTYNIHQMTEDKK